MTDLMDPAQVPDLNEKQLVELTDRLTKYRKLKDEVDALSVQMEALKADIRPIVEAMGGKYQDKIGYVRTVARAASISYPSAEVEKLVTSWLTSTNDIMKSCGMMLAQHRSSTASSTYLQIK